MDSYILDERNEVRALGTQFINDYLLNCILTLLTSVQYHTCLNYICITNIRITLIYILLIQQRDRLKSKIVKMVADNDKITDTNTYIYIYQQ